MPTAIALVREAAMAAAQIPAIVLAQPPADHLVRVRAIVQADLLRRDHLALQAGVQDQVVEVVIHLRGHLLQEVAVPPALLAEVRQAEALAGKTKKQGHEKIINNIATVSNIERESYSPGQPTLRLLYRCPEV
jgi:hypothetical protein